VARRIEIELTSTQPDGTWTWRAAGARQPRGVLDGGLLYDAAKPGDVLKAEAEFEIEGITIVSVSAPKASSRPEPERIEILGSDGPEAPGVTTQLVGRSDRRPGERRRERDEARPRRDREAGRSTGRDTSRPRRESPPSDRAGAPATESASAGGADEKPRRPARSGRPERRERGERTTGPTGSDPAPGGTGRGRETSAGRRSERPTRRPERTPQSEPVAESRTRRFNPGHTHRHAVMASLPPEQQPIAEQVLRGGIPAVRTALHIEREKAVAAGRAAPNTDQLIAMAEALLPRLKAAEWHDRAEAAAKDVDDISLRDLRSVVAAADAARHEETRALAASLREALDRRVEAQRAGWSEEVTGHLDENRLVRALRLAARPPEPAARLDPQLLERLSDAASQAMAADVPADRWLTLLDAVSASPVRRSVKPVGLPADPSPELRRATHQQSGRIPALAAMLGITIPPPPIPAPSRRQAAASKAPLPRRPPPPPTKHREPDLEPDLAGTPGPSDEPSSTEGGQDPVIVEELGEAVREG